MPHTHHLPLTTRLGGSLPPYIHQKCSTPPSQPKESLLSTVFPNRSPSPWPISLSRSQVGPTYSNVLILFSQMCMKPTSIIHISSVFPRSTFDLYGIDQLTWRRFPLIKLSIIDEMFQRFLLEILEVPLRRVQFTKMGLFNKHLDNNTICFWNFNGDHLYVQVA